MVTPALYEGHVMHTRPRHAPGRYLFRHRVYFWLVDVDHLPRLPRLLRPLGQIESRDHLGDRDRSIRDNIDHYLHGYGIDLDGGRVLQLTNARVLGYVFNPLSVYWCHGPGGELRCVIAEVHNTYGERHCYLLRPDDRGRAEANKAFYVSPFLTVEGTYRMAIGEPGERLSIQMALDQHDRRVFHASLTGRRHPLSTRRLLSAAARHPLMTIRVTALIHLHGLALWLRRVPRVPRPARHRGDGVG